MAFIVRNLTGSTVEINDLGLSLAALTDYDLAYDENRDIADSDDLISAINADTVIILDPLGGSPTLPLSKAESIKCILYANNPHFGIVGGKLRQIDDVTISGSPALPTNDQVLIYNTSTSVWENHDAAPSDRFQSIATISTDYSSTTNIVVLVNTTTAGVTITLPTAAAFAKKFFHIKWIAGPSKNKVTIITQTGETLDDQTEVKLGQLYDSLNVVSDGSNWWII